MLELEQVKEHFLSATTSTLGFRLLARTDCYPLLDASKNNDFNKHLAWSAPENAADLMPKIDSLIRETQMNKSVTFSTVEKHTGKWVGISKWTPYKESYMYTAWVHPDYWGSKISVDLVYYGYYLMFQASNRKELYALIKPENTKILRILNKMKAVTLDQVDYPHENGHNLELSELKLFKIHVDQMGIKPTIHL